jgi:hypothetical protein
MNAAPPYGHLTAVQNITGQLLNWAVWVMFAISFVVYVEPAPTDALFAVVIILFAFMKIEAAVCVMPLLFMLVLYNFGGFLSYVQAPPQPKALMFIVTSAYMALSAVVFALYVAANPMKHLEIIGAAWSIGAVIASIFGMIDYFNLPTPFPLQVMPGRATGLFKDPNVFSTYIIFPMIFMLQKLIYGTSRRPVLIAVALAITILGLFLSFSRGAWANFIMAAAMLCFFTFILFNSDRLRVRLFIYIVGGLIFATIAFLILMSIPQVRDMFAARFSLVQSYDAGETGRFGNQVRSIPELLKLPLGYGPFVFPMIYGQNPHNVFLNAFACYGWLGGVTYFVLIISTLMIGLRTIFTRTPWQALSITVFCSLASVIFQGVQIDTEHWRHFYWMLGIMWGLFAITMQPNLIKSQENDFRSGAPRYA